MITEYVLGEGITWNADPAIFAKLIGGGVMRGEVDVEDKQSANEPHSQKDIDDEQDIHDKKANLGAFVQPDKRNDNWDETEKGHEEETADEGVEPFIISVAYAGADPRAVVVESFHADVALVAMGGAGWSVDVASWAEFYFQIVGFYWQAVYFCCIAHHSILVFLVDGNPSEFFVLVRGKNFGDHAGVGEPQYQQKDLDHDVKDDY